MTDGTPSADLTARVLARIDDHHARSWARRLVWLAAPVAAAATLALIVFLGPFQHADRGTGTVTQPPPIVRITARPLPPSPSPSQQTAPATAQTDASPPNVTMARNSIAAPRPRVRAPSEIESMAPPPLEVSSIAVPSLPISDIGTPSIAVAPLETIAPIVVSPIGGGDHP